MIPIPFECFAMILGYIGPGGGISLFGPLLGVLFAVIGAFAMIAFWPIRILIKRARTAGNAGLGNAQLSEESKGKEEG
ncbi:MAG: hypothetical protein JW829_20895 [Pirellulales bacterium]|nr:hypothetical protein [Pirellulales bacterium]